MITSKEKATQLCIKYYDGVSVLNRKYSIQCAIVAVREIIATLNEYSEDSNIGHHTLYWEEVKEELLKM